MLKNKKILVTGGAGFIGSHLAERLVDLGNDVTILDDLSVTDKNLSLLEKNGVKKIICDISNYGLMLANIKDFDIVFHLAAMNRALRSIKDPLKSNLVNVTGTLNVLEACRINNIKKLINISSSSIYGASKIFPRKEENELKPTIPYGVGKLAGEHYSNIYYKLYGLDTVNLRYFSIYGPRQLGIIDYAAVIPKFIHKIFTGQQIEIYGDGKQKRNFTYVGDAVELSIRAAIVKQAVGETFNISNEESITINELVKLMEEVIGKKASCKYVEKIKGEINENPADVSKARRILKLEAKTPLREGLSKTIEWCKNEEESIKQV